MMYLTKRYALSLSHLVMEDASAEGPLELHGHNLKIDVTIKGEPNNKSGHLVDRMELDQVVKEYLIDKFNNRHINDLLNCGTGEIMAQNFLKILRGSHLGDTVASVQIVETRKNRFICYN